MMQPPDVSFFHRHKKRDPNKELKRMVLSGKKAHSTPTPKLEESSWIDDFRDIMILSGQAYEGVAEVNAAFNRIAATISEKLIYTDTAARDIEDYNNAMEIVKQISLIVTQALRHGHAICRITRTKFTVCDSPDFIFDENMNQLLLRRRIDYELHNSDLMAPSEEVVELDPEKYQFFILNPLHTLDKFGLPAAKPVLSPLDLSSGVSQAEGKAGKRYVKPAFLVTAPDGATQAERTQVLTELQDMTEIEDLVLPAGFEAQIVGTGKDQYKSEELLDRTSQRTITGLGIPKLALSIPEGTSKDSAQYSLDLLYDKCVPMARTLVARLNKVYLDLFMVPDVWKIRKMSIFDIEMQAKSRMLNYEGLKMLSSAAAEEGLDPAAKEILINLILNFREPEV
jgi:hypothetical protein